MAKRKSKSKPEDEQATIDTTTGVAVAEPVADEDPETRVDEIRADLFDGDDQGATSHPDEQGVADDDATPETSTSSRGFAFSDDEIADLPFGDDDRDNGAPSNPISSDEPAEIDPVDETAAEDAPAVAVDEPAERSEITVLPIADLLGQTDGAVDPVSGARVVEIVDQGGRLTVTGGLDRLITASVDGKTVVPVRITTMASHEKPYPRLVALAQIITDQRLQPRVNLSERTIDEYADRMREGDTFPPVDVYRDAQGFYWLTDGWHRYYATERVGRDEIAAHVFDGELEDAILAAASANATSGLQRTNDDKRRAVQTLLTHPRCVVENWSDSEIASRSKTSRRFVQVTRERLERDGTIDVSTTRRGADGKTYTKRQSGDPPTDVPSGVEGVAAPIPDADEDEPVQMYECGFVAEDDDRECGQAFAVPTWHCPSCSGHFAVDEYTRCPNCDPADTDDAAVEPVRPIGQIVDEPMPRDETTREPQARYDPGTIPATTAISATSAFRMVETALDMVVQYSGQEAGAVAVVPSSDDAARKTLDKVSAALDWLMEYEDRLKDRLGIERNGKSS